MISETRPMIVQVMTDFGQVSCTLPHTDPHVLEYLGQCGWYVRIPAETNIAATVDEAAEFANSLPKRVRWVLDIGGGKGISVSAINGFTGQGEHDNPLMIESVFRLLDWFASKVVHTEGLIHA